MNYIFYKVIRFIGRPLFKIVFRPEYIGRENIPFDGPVILCGNHTSILDAAIMICAPKRVVHMMAKQEIFNNKIFHFFFTKMACIPVNRNIHDKNAKDKAMLVLKNNEVLGLFPEGTVNKTNNTILPFKYGAVSFAKKTNAYIVPFSITGKYKVFKKSVKIIYGKPYKVKNDLKNENKKLEGLVSKLIKEGKE